MPETNEFRALKDKCTEYHTKVDSLMRAIYGNGQPGLIDEVADIKSDGKSFRAVWEQREKDKMKYDDHSAARQKWLMGLAGLILALLAFFGISARLTHTAVVSVDKPAVTAQNKGITHAGADLSPQE